MDTVLGNSFEAAKCIQARQTCCFQQAERLLYPIVAGDADYLDLGLLASCNDRGIVLLFAPEVGLLSLPGGVGEGVHLPGASVKARAVRKLQSRLQACRAGRARVCLPVY